MAETPIQANPFDHLMAAPEHPLRMHMGLSTRAEKLLRSNFTELRKAAGLTQSEVCDKTDWSMAKMHRLENGPSAITVSNAYALLSVYGVTDQDQKHSLLD